MKKSTKIVSIGWKENERFVAMGKLIQQRKARRLYYSCDKFYYEVDEATSMKLKSLIGKTTFNPRDFQRIITAIISKTYDTQKGKVFK